MNDKQTKKINMYISLKDVLNKNLNHIEKIKELKNIYDKFIENVKKLNELKTEVEVDIQPDNDFKATARINLVKLTVPVAGILQVFAYDMKDKELAKKVNYSRNKLIKSKDASLVEKCDTIKKCAKQLFGKSLNDSDTKKKSEVNISSYGINGQMIDELEQAVKLFINSILKLKESIAYKNKCGKKITLKINETDDLLRNKMDKMMTIFENIDQTFYNEYRNTRTVLKIEKEKAKLEKKAVKTAEKEAKKNKKNIVSEVQADEQVHKPETVETGTKISKSPVKKSVAAKVVEKV